MKVSVVICSVGFSPLFQKAITSLVKNSITPYEIIIVHQGKGDKTKDISNQFERVFSKIRYIQDSGFGLSRARNIGYKCVDGDIVSFTDDDAYVGQYWIENIIKTFNNDNNIGIVGGKIVPVYDQKNVNWEIPDVLNYILPSYSQGEEVGEYPSSVTPPGVNFSIRRQILTEMGGFNEYFGYNISKKVQITGEDTDLAIRVKRAGYRIIYSPQCIVYHPVPLTRQNLAYLKKRMFVEGNTDTYLFLLHDKPSFRYKLNLFKYRLIELVRHFKSKKNMNSNLYEGVKSRILGCLYSILINGLFFQKSCD